MKQRTKFILTYVAGIVTGIVLLFVVGFFMAKSQATSASNDDVGMFEKPRSIVPGKVFEVMQVLLDGSALATVDDFESGNLGTIVLSVGDDSKKVMSRTAFKDVKERVEFRSYEQVTKLYETMCIQQSIGGLI